MRFLGIGDYCDLSSMYLRLIAEGHQVKISISEPLCQGTLGGMAPRVDNWRDELDWVREAGDDGIILFENVAEGMGAVQDDLRNSGYHVIGGCAFGDRLENDRAYAQDTLRDLGLPTALMREFYNYAEAADFVGLNPARYVLKFNGDTFGAADNFVGQLKTGRDVLAVLAAKFRQTQEDTLNFVLMAHVEGIEMGVGAYFDGRDFLLPACLDWEHKKFFPGDLGELTGEMGTVVTYDRTQKFFERTLGRMTALLRQHGYCGYINLNTIVNEDGVWPLEFTCRFGYPGFAILQTLQKTSWSSLFRRLITGIGAGLETRAGFALGVVMTTRPFPYVRTFVPEPVGLPILFDGDLSASDKSNLHFGEVGMDGDQLVTAGYHGWSMVVTGVGATLGEASDNAYRLARRVVIPNVRYRNDIGAKLVAGDLAALERLEMFSD